MTRWLIGVECDFYAGNRAVISAAAIPVAVSIQLPRLGDALLGAFIGVAEGIHHVYQFQQRGITLSIRPVALERKIMLYEAKAEPYQNQSETLLATRVDAVLSTEHLAWVESYTPPKKSKQPATDN
jgi:hypothetical protein